MKKKNAIFIVMENMKEWNISFPTYIIYPKKN